VRYSDIPKDPLTQTYYIYGTNSNYTEYEISTTLENAIAYNNLLIPQALASSQTAKVV